MRTRLPIRSLAGITACLVLGYFAFIKGTRVPLLGGVDLGFHELGHLLTYAFSDVITAAMGSITQITVPLGLGLYFMWGRKDRVAGGLCLAWASTSAQDASVYISDAPFERLQLIGGDHDWAFLLGPEHLNILDSAHVVGATVKGFGFVMLLAGISLCAASPILEKRALAAAERNARSRPSGGWAVIPPWEDDR